MRRELWSVGCCFGYAIRVLNGIFCTDVGTKKPKEQELDNEEMWLVVEQINSLCSQMMIEDASDIIGMLSVIPRNRLCERTDCQYHHPEHFQKQNHTCFQDKCDDCHHNEKCADPDSAINHFEDE